MKRKSDLPCLLVEEKLVGPLASAIYDIKALRDRAKIADSKDALVLRGIAVLGLSYFEVGVADALKYYLRHFPQKLKGDEFRFSKDTLLREHSRLLNTAS